MAENSNKRNGCAELVAVHLFLFIITLFIVEGDVFIACLICSALLAFHLLVKLILFADRHYRKAIHAYDLSAVDRMDGHSFEHYVCQLMQRQGFDASVTRGSGDHGADIIAIKKGVRYAVQVKNRSSRVSNKAIQEAVASKLMYQCHESMVVTNQHFTKGAIELAAANQTILVDRAILSKWIADMQKR